MADETNEAVPDEIKDSPHFAQLRKQKETVEGQLAQAREVITGLRGQLIRNAVELAGFTPNPETGDFDGVTGLLVREFQATIADDKLPTKAEFLALAGQYQVTPPTSTTGTTAATEPTLADQIASMQQGATQLQALGTVPPAGDGDGIEARMAQALQTGSVRTGLSLFAQQLATPTPAAS